LKITDENNEPIRTVIFDIESNGLQPWYGDRITCICAKDSDGNRFSLVHQDEQKIIEGFLAWLQDRCPAKFKFVTFNGKCFDTPFLLARLAQTVDLDKRNGLFLLDYPHIDLYEKVITLTGKRLSLDTVARLLGCTAKSGTGKGAIELWKTGKWEKLKEYCMNDVDVTEEVYLKLTK